MKHKIIKEHITNRGGLVSIDLTPLGFEGQSMTAYQNSLGGGMLGKVFTESTVNDDKLKTVHLELRQYLHNQTNPSKDSWEYMSFDNNQKLLTTAIV